MLSWKVGRRGISSIHSFLLKSYTFFTALSGGFLLKHRRCGKIKKGVDLHG